MTEMARDERKMNSFIYLESSAVDAQRIEENNRR